MLLLFQVAAQVLSLTNSLGIYIHIPFCKSKCTYCNFYSFCGNDLQKEEYTLALCRDIVVRGKQINRRVTSVYFGGGTPSVLSTEQLCRILNAIKQNFSVVEDAEITIEANPADNLGEMLPELRKVGFNRLSLGVQSANSDELKVLGRRHTKEDAANAVKVARQNGFNNISLDLMLGLPKSTTEELKNSLEFLCSLSPEHISAYILKLERGTPLFEAGISLPNDDETAEQYLFACRYLKDNGYSHYEISNFAKKNFEARHNTLYWKCGEYLGFGPSAHSYFGSKRFFYENNIDSYILGDAPVDDGIGGTMDEYIMLGLRLKDGISNTQFNNLFGKDLPKALFQKASLYQKNGLCHTDGEKISLTDEGMLLSNSIITSFLEEFNL